MATQPLKAVRHRLSDHHINRRTHRDTELSDLLPPAPVGNIRPDGILLDHARNTQSSAAALRLPRSTGYVKYRRGATVGSTGVATQALVEIAVKD